MSTLPTITPAKKLRMVSSLIPFKPSTGLVVGAEDAISGKILEKPLGVPRQIPVGPVLPIDDNVPVHAALLGTFTSRSASARA